MAFNSPAGDGSGFCGAAPPGLGRSTSSSFASVFALSSTRLSPRRGALPKRIFPADGRATVSRVLLDNSRGPFGKRRPGSRKNRRTYSRGSGMLFWS